MKDRTPVKGSMQWAKWVVFHRLFTRRLNAFMRACRSALRGDLEDLGIVSCPIGRREVAFEVVEEMMLPERIDASSRDDLIQYRANVVSMLTRIDAIGARTESLEPFEAFQLSDWLGIDVGKYVAVRYTDETDAI